MVFDQLKHYSPLFQLLVHNNLKKKFCPLHFQQLIKDNLLTLVNVRSIK